MDIIKEKFDALRDAANGNFNDPQDIQTLLNCIEDVEKLCKQIKISQESYKAAWSDASNRVHFISQNFNDPKTLRDQFQDVALKRFVESILVENERLHDIIKDGIHKAEFVELCEENKKLKKDLLQMKEQLVIRFKELKAIKMNETENVRLNRETVLANLKVENVELKERFLMMNNIMTGVKKCFSDMSKEMVKEFQNLSQDYNMDEVTEAMSELSHQNIPAAFRNPSRPTPMVPPPSMPMTDDERADSGISSMDDAQFRRAAFEQARLLQQKLEEKNEKNRQLSQDNEYLKDQITKYQSSEAIRDAIQRHIEPFKKEYERLEAENESYRNQEQEHITLKRKHADLENEIKSLRVIIKDLQTSPSTSNRDSNALLRLHASNSWPDMTDEPTSSDLRRVVSENPPSSSGSSVFNTQQLLSSYVHGDFRSTSRMVLVADGETNERRTVSRDNSPDESRETSPSSSRRPPPENTDNE